MRTFSKDPRRGMGRTPGATAERSVWPSWGDAKADLALARSLGVQPKLALQPSDDPLEDEADHIAESFTQGAPPTQASAGAAKQAPCAACETGAACPKCQAQALRHEGTSPSAAPASTGVAAGSASGGQPLPPTLRGEFENFLGADFSRVRIHASSSASESAEALNARAYTLGEDIVFARGEFSPDTSRGRHLLAHEMAHVVQQQGGERRVARQVNESPPAPVSHRSEVEALLNQRDEVAGVGDPGAAVRLLRDLSTGDLLETLRDMEAHGSLPLLGPYVNVDPRVSAAYRAAELRTRAGTAPEEMAEFREQVLRLSAPDRAAIIRFYPDAQAPAEPALPAGGLVPPPGTNFGSYPSALLETLWRSYTRRTLGMPGSRNNLANAFWGGRPTSFWDALTRLGPALDIVRQVYTRTTATGLSWSLIDVIHNIWGGGSLGFNFASTSRATLESGLSSSSRFCRDVALTGGLYHHVIEGNTPCWRECVSGTPGLHFCTGGDTPSVHVDPTQVVEEREEDGGCNYDMGEVYQHFRDLGWVP